MSARPERDAEVTEWLRYADNDLLVAEQLIGLSEPRFLKIIAFHVQQAIEKYIKGLLVFTGTDFPHTHDLTALLALLPIDFVSPVSPPLLELITDYAVDLRYPEYAEDVTRAETETALQAARIFRAAVVTHLPQHITQ